MRKTACWDEKHKVGVQSDKIAETQREWGKERVLSGKDLGGEIKLILTPPNMFANSQNCHGDLSLNMMWIGWSLSSYLYSVHSNKFTMILTAVILLLQALTNVGLSSMHSHLHNNYIASLWACLCVDKINDKIYILTHDRLYSCMTLTAGTVRTLWNKDNPASPSSSDIGLLGLH